MRNLMHTVAVPPLAVLAPVAAEVPSAIGPGPGPAPSPIHPAGLGLDPPMPSLPPRPRRIPVIDVVRTEKVVGGVVVTTCALEAAAVRSLACDPDIELIAIRPHVLTLTAPDRSPSGPSWFVPDLVARRRDRSVLAVALLPSWERDRSDPVWATTERAVRAAYANAGVAFAVWTDWRLFARQPRINHERMLRERAGEAGAADLPRVLKALGQMRYPTTVAAVHRRARLALGRTLACLMELALAGSVSLDLARPLDGAAVVRRGKRG